MKTHEFSIIASGLNPEAEDFETRFYDAGCDDATVSFQKGHIILDFAREAKFLEDAIVSAVQDVRKAGARVDRVEPDPLVSLSEMAARVGLTRAAMTNYFKGDRAENFPAPVARITSNSPLWDWSVVAKWMYENDKLDKDAAVDAEVVRQVNQAICENDPDLAGRVEKGAKDYAKTLEAA